MKILVVGSGGREHAIAWKLAQSDRRVELFAAPGNPGIKKHAACVDIKADDLSGLIRFAISEGIDLVAVGPEAPLCMGLADLLREAGVPVFGPSAQAAAIEGSKRFSKELMRTYHIPTAAFETFRRFENARDYARSMGADMWIKASGLAAGKGAVYASNPDEAERILREMMVESIFGESGSEVVIEENMTGEEASIFAVCDGVTFKTIVSSQDHKRAYDFDKGPNTGGMGAYAPAPVITSALMERIEREVLQPTLDGMAAERKPYRGLLYAGIMVTSEGPKVVEYNCRFGDPETQAVLPLLDGDLAEIMLAAAEGSIENVQVGTKEGSALCVVMASGGYPGSYKKGFPVSGLEKAETDPSVKVFHAGTALRDGRVVTAGGRVLGVTGWGGDFPEAHRRAYDAVGKITFWGEFHRADIGHRAIQRTFDEARKKMMQSKPE
ncbi:MAG: phosphoribosylamine--glycine ligase [Candidatus Latescibacterota bacterium]